MIKQYQCDFIPINCLMPGNTSAVTIFINKMHIECVYKSADDVILTLINQKQYIIPDTNIQVFMDRFKQ